MCAQAYIEGPNLTTGESWIGSTFEADRPAGAVMVLQCSFFDTSWRGLSYM